MTPQRDYSNSDESLLDQVIAEYLQAESAGQTGSRQAWLDRYPDFAAGLAEFLDDREQLDRLTMPVRAEHAANRENVPEQ
jgi:hypothetical protein